MAAARAAHEEEKRAWAEARQAQVQEMLGEARAELEARSAEKRTREIEVVVAKLGTEMTLASKAAEARLEREKGELEARHARATQEHEEQYAQLKAKYSRAVEAANDREADCRTRGEALAEAKQQLAASSGVQQQLTAALAAQRAEVGVG